MTNEAIENRPTALEQSPLCPNFKDGESAPDAMERVANGTLSDIVALEKNLIVLEDENDYIGLNVGVGLSYIIDLLADTNDIFYVGFSGSKGSGKSKATSVCALIVHNGIKIEAITFPALAHACSEKMTLCLDEVDSQGERCPDLTNFIRQGIRIGATYVKMIPAEGKDWENKLIPCGGMKFVNWNNTNKIDSAFLQRILVIKTTPRASDRVILNNESPERFTTPIRQWFECQSAQAHARWNKDTVRALIEDKDGSLEQAMSRVASSIPRQKQKSVWMLIVARIFDWDIENIIRKLIEKQPEDDLFEDQKQIIRDIIESEFVTRGKRGPFTMLMSDLKKRLDELCIARGVELLRTSGDFSYASFRQDIQFVDGVNEHKRSQLRGGRTLEFDARVFKALEVDLETLHQSTVDEVDTKAKIADAVRMFADGRTVEDIELSVGREVMEHCRIKGLIPVIGGR